MCPPIVNLVNLINLVNLTLLTLLTAGDRKGRPYDLTRGQGDKVTRLTPSLIINC